ncbi:MAG: lactonase family protein [Lachnospiraceae bacterium]|nr:lactonase family protein [Lachnospiraceae bacterium]
MGQNNGEKYVAYIGSYTHGKAKGITICDVDVEKGRCTKRKEVEINNPSYMVAANSGKYLYSICDEGLAAYLILPDGDLELINRASINGMRGCHITINKDDSYLFVAGYHDAKATVVKVREDGGIGEVTDEMYNHGLGSVGERNFRAHISCAALTPDEKYLMVCDMGIDQVKAYRFDKAKGKLKLVDILRCELESAPRTMIFSPDGRFAYLLCELKNYISIYTYQDGGKGPVFELIERVSAVENRQSNITASVAIKMSKDGKYVFVTSAGGNGLAFFRRNVEEGRLRRLSVLPISGEFPKDFMLLPDEKHFVSLNHDSNQLTFFTLNYEQGIIIMNGHPIDIEKPNCGIIVKINN